jgi:uncharacterized cupredoxin-like copper-binding protein
MARGETALVRKLVAVASVALVATFVTECGDGDNDESAEPGTVAVTLSDFKIDLEQTTAPAGEVTFKVENKGPSLHEFVVFKTDKADDALPTDDNGDVAEGADFEPVDEIEDIAKGDRPELKVALEAGTYVLVCNVPAHYRQGMHTSFTVS